MSGMMSVYVHIPFCVQKCGYCDFLSFPVGQYGGQKKDVDRDGCEKCVPEEYLRRLLGEIRRESGSAYERGRKMCEKLKEEIPRHLFEIPQKAFMSVLKLDEDK